MKKSSGSVFAGGALVFLAAASLLTGCAAEAEPLEVTYYYLPG